MTTSTDLAAAAERFDKALSRLESGVAAAVSKVADIARRAGYEDGLAAARAEAPAVPVDADETAPALREALAAAEAREHALERAVAEARAALDDAIDDIRSAIGPI